MLEVEGLSVRFGGLLAVHAVSLQLRPGEIIGLIGPNGAGKTTLFNALTGFVRPSTGRVRLDGQDVTGVPPHKLARLGVARTFQVERPFEDLTVLDNVMTASYLHHPRHAAARQHALSVLDRVGLADRADQKCSELNLARRRRLEIGKALALEPRVLFLDEVIAGLNPPAQAEMIEFVRSLAQGGAAIIMVEHIMRVIMSLSDHIICLAFGQVIATGKPAEVASNPAVIDAYLGGGEDD
ncbi:MAG TPA: ABC transporter ATP-binding protein [Deinococcales bacterium]|nr:ABC transporter ATP-binding protein [Deinococcales bacterium]